jgi:hypothetical protein
MSVNDAIAKYDTYKKLLFIQLMPIKTFEMAPESEDILHHKVGDIAIVACARPESPEAQFMSTKLRKRVFHAMGKNSDTVFNDALENAPKLYPAKIAPLTSDIGGYCLSTATGRHGAAAIFYPGHMKQLYWLMKEEYYVVPVSVSCVMIHPVSSVKLEDARKMTADRDGEDFLSDTVFRYDKATDSLVAAE